MISKWIKVESQELQHLQIAADMLDFAATMPTGNSPEAVENRDLFVRRASLDLMASIDDIAHRTEGSAFERMGGITVVVGVTPRTVRSCTTLKNELATWR